MATISIEAQVAAARVFVSAIEATVIGQHVQGGQSVDWGEWVKALTCVQNARAQLQMAETRIEKITREAGG